MTYFFSWSRSHCPLRDNNVALLILARFAHMSGVWLVIGWLRMTLAGMTGSFLCSTSCSSSSMSISWLGRGQEQQAETCKWSPSFCLCRLVTSIGQSKPHDQSYRTCTSEKIEPLIQSTCHSGAAHDPSHFSISH